MMEHIPGQTCHARRGAIKNAFRFGVDYVLCDLDAPVKTRLLSRNRFNLWSIWDREHGGVRGNGNGVEWFRNELAARGFSDDRAQLLLLAQPTFLWFHFNPVCFWIALRDGQLCAFIAEVNNTFGDRHCYFCAHEDFRPIKKHETLVAEKLMHVSPFQKVAGLYRFNFDLSDRAINIRISHENGDEGVVATLTGARRNATDRSLFVAALRRPFGAARVLALIHLQALILYFKRAPFLPKPVPPRPLVSESTGFTAKQS